VGKVEIIARIERRRKWTVEEEAALLAEVEAEGGRVAVVTRRHSPANPQPVSKRRGRPPSKPPTDQTYG
jgi:hypothetical protein